MYRHKSTSVLFWDDDSCKNFQIFAAHCRGIPHLKLDVRSRLPQVLSAWDVIVTAVEALSDNDGRRLTDFVGRGGGWLHFFPQEATGAPALFGVQPKPSGPRCELRICWHDPGHPWSVRLSDAIYVEEYYHPLALKTDDVKIILYADWQHQHSAVLVERRHGDGIAACTTLQDFRHGELCQIFYRLVRRLGGSRLPTRGLGIGILGYAPWVGPYHGQGVTRTPGLELVAACDLNAERLQQAQMDFPGIRTVASAEALGADPDVDLVILVTPPKTHARLALQMMAAGKHVVCEKPLALTSAETAAMAEAARQGGLHLSCHQNRRWDVDYLAIKQALDEGLIGELFYLETFVGGFSHPCGYWHSDAAVSGGTVFDWGGHYIDWIISLCSEPVAAVIGTRHKRVWQDVTNADQERIQIRFAGGCEAEFMHSDIAAARKPKWYLLGTRGAIVGNWQDITEYEIDPVHYFQQHDIPATEMPPDLTIYRRHGSGKVTSLKPAIPDRPLFGFHRNLADHLLTGEPVTAPLDDAVRVVAVLEAAARSMANGGRIEVPDV